MIEIRDAYPLSEWPRLLSFIRERYREDHALCARDFFDWQFRIRPGQAEAPILTAWDGGEIAGILGYLPLPVRWSGARHDGAWTLYWMTTPQAPKGLGWTLHRRLQEKYRVALTVNTSAQGGPILRAMGWSFVARVPRHLFVLDAAACAPLLSPGADARGLDGFAFQGKSAGRSAPRPVAADAGRYAPDWSLYPGLDFGTERSLEYMRWRYLDHPVFAYRVILKGPKGRPAVCVYRVEKIFGAREALAGRVVDLFHPGDEAGGRDGRDALETALRFMKEDRCAFAEFVCSRREYRKTAESLGGAEEPAERLILPSRLAPLQHLKRDQNLAFYADKGLARPEPDLIHCSRSDIDGDSPTNANLPDRKRTAGPAVFDSLD